MPYIGKSPGKLGVRQRYYYTATGSETSKSGTDDNGISLKFEDGEYVDVYLNGSLLVAGSDYNTNTTNTISGLAALAANDILEIVVYDIFSLAKVNTEAQRTKYYKTASGGETSITGTDDSGATITFSAGAQIDVHLNGVSLKQGDDYNTTTANTVGGLTALTAGQLVEIVVYEKFVLADMVKKSGDTMTGALSAPSVSTTGNITATGNVDVGGSLLVDTVKEGTGTNTAMTINSSGVVNFNNAPTGFTTGFTFPAAQSLNGVSERNFTGIPSGVTLIKFAVWRHDGSTSPARFMIQLGDSGGIETTGYNWGDQYFLSSLNHNSASNDSAWKLGSWSGTSNVLMHQGEIFNVHGNKWLLNANAMYVQDTGYFIHYHGYKELSGELTQIQFGIKSGTFDDSNSYVRIGYQ